MSSFITTKTTIFSYSSSFSWALRSSSTVEYTYDLPGGGHKRNAQLSLRSSDDPFQGYLLLPCKRMSVGLPSMLEGLGRTWARETEVPPEKAVCPKVQQGVSVEVRSLLARLAYLPRIFTPAASKSPTAELLRKRNEGLWRKTYRGVLSWPGRVILMSRSSWDISILEICMIL